MKPLARSPLPLALALLAACGKGSDEPAPPPPDPPPAEASRFLQQATFGPTAADIVHLGRLGFDAWIDEQMAKPASLHRPLLDELAGSGEKNWTYDFRIEAWWRRVVYGDDQLRQRVAWALSQIFVISDGSDAISADLEGLTSYYDVLVTGAFGTFRELLEAVSLSPQMGGYLSMLQNQRPDPERNVFPDENFAREVMQLFSIGLVELEPDGTPRVDDEGAPVATYDQAVVEGLAHAFTGWNYAGADQWRSDASNTVPMEPWEEYHDRGPKRFFGKLVSEGEVDARAEMGAILDGLAAHPNVGPFLGRQLIQRLVTSNPGPDYVRRVAAVFDDDGTGERGDLGAVVRAILLDPEARGARPEHFGKVREPLLRLTALWRGFGGRSTSGWVDFPWPDQVIGQAPLRSPTVFNFYRPDHVPPGEMAEQGLAAPELALATHTWLTRTSNELLLRVRAGTARDAGREVHEVDPDLRISDPVDPPEQPGMVLDLARELALIEEPDELVAWLDTLLFAGEMSTELSSTLSGFLADAPRGSSLDANLRDAIFLAVGSPEYSVQR